MLHVLSVVHDCKIVKTSHTSNRAILVSAAGTWIRDAINPLRMSREQPEPAPLSNSGSRVGAQRRNEVVIDLPRGDRCHAVTVSSGVPVSLSRTMAFLILSITGKLA